MDKGSGSPVFSSDPDPGDLKRLDPDPLYCLSGHQELKFIFADKLHANKNHNCRSVRKAKKNYPVGCYRELFIYSF